jgi:hypothetical protein
MSVTARIAVAHQKVQFKIHCFVRIIVDFDIFFNQHLLNPCLKTEFKINLLKNRKDKNVREPYLHIFYDVIPKKLLNPWPWPFEMKR